MQSLRVASPASVYAALARRGVRVALVRSARGPALTFLLTARHSTDEIDRAFDALRESMAPRLSLSCP